MKKCQIENHDLRKHMMEHQRTHSDEQQGLRRTNDELRNALREKDDRIAKLATDLEKQKQDIQMQYKEKQRIEHQLFDLREDYDKVSTKFLLCSTFVDLLITHFTCRFQRNMPL